MIKGLLELIDGGTSALGRRCAFLSAASSLPFGSWDQYASSAWSVGLGMPGTHLGCFFLRALLVAESGRGVSCIRPSIDRTPRGSASSGVPLFGSMLSSMVVAALDLSDMKEEEDLEEASRDDGDEKASRSRSRSASSPAWCRSGMAVAGMEDSEDMLRWWRRWAMVPVWARGRESVVDVTLAYEERDGADGRARLEARSSAFVANRGKR